MRIKIILGTDYTDLSNQVNDFLESAVGETKVDVDIKNIAAVVYYDSHHPKSICSECRFFDDSGQPDSLIGVCQMKGKRVRFSDKSCCNYADIRG